MIFSVYVISYTESERGWGQRPDGRSFHKSKEEAFAFKADYESKGNSEIYSFGDDPKIVEVSESIFNIIQEKGSVWDYHLKLL